MATKKKTRPTIKYRYKGSSKYTPELFKHICKGIENGLSIAKACKSQCRRTGKDPQTVSPNTFKKWVNMDVDGCAEYYDAAVKMRTDLTFESLVDFIDDAIAETAAIAKAKEQIATRKWCLSKITPSKYGDKITQEHTGAGGGPIEISNLTDDELDEKINLLMKEK